MKAKLLVLIIFACCYFSLYAILEAEPNDSMTNDNVLWAENGHHEGWFNYPNDLDFWKFYGYPGDTVVISTLGYTTMDTVIRLYDENGVELAFNDDYNGSTQSYLSYTVNDDRTYYIRLNEYWGNPGPYGFDISGEFLSFSVIPSLPFGFNIENGASGIDVNTPVITWTYGDSSGGGSWNFAMGTDPNYLQTAYMGYSPIESRQGAFDVSVPLAGGITYYYTPLVMDVYHLVAPYELRSFSTSQTYRPLPATENFNLEPHSFVEMDNSGIWTQGEVDPAQQNSELMVGAPSTTAILMEKSIYDLTAYPDAYLKFDHIAIMQDELDHAYVEFSTDGGSTWTVFPVSSYFGSGVYSVPTGNNPEGPCFDAGSYSAWANYTSGDPVNAIWRTDYFDLSPWHSCNAFRIRFRGTINEDEVYSVWVIDNLEVNFHAPTVAANPYPGNGSAEISTNLPLSWTALHASSYEIAFGTNPGNLTSTIVTQPSWIAQNLTPYTTYYWKVRSINSFASSGWSDTWTFSTQQYETPWHQNAGLSIVRVIFGSIDHSSGWEGYTYYYNSITSQAQCGIDLPISVYLAGGYGPEGVRVWIDINRDAVFDNSVNGGEYWDIPWGNGCFQGFVHLPSHLFASASRMRIQAIHTDGSDYLHPSGIFNYGETEDYLLFTTDAPILAYSPGSGAFADTIVGCTSDPLSFSFWNTGGQSLNITLIGFEGSGSGSFILPDGLAFPINLSTNTASVDIRFLPQTTGLINANMLIRDNLTRTDHFIPLSGTGLPLPAAPVNLSLSSFGNNLMLSWDAVSGAMGYRVYSSALPEGPYILEVGGETSTTQWQSANVYAKRFYRVVSIVE